MKALRPFILLLLAYSSLPSSAQDDQTAKDTAYDMVAIAVQPEFPGGLTEMYVWMQKNTAYPDSAYLKGIQGKVFVEFVVEKDGQIDEVVLRRGVNQWLDEEAVRVVGQMPAWKPGRLEDGTAVRARFTIPIDFKL